MMVEENNLRAPKLITTYPEVIPSYVNCDYVQYNYFARTKTF